MKRTFRLDHWILLATIPTLVVVTIALGIVVYLSLYDRILRGFDQKLLAAVGVTSAFIDGDDHAALLTPVPLRALEWDAAAGALFGVDSSGQVYTVSDATGEADPVPGAVIEPSLDIALVEGRLFSLTEDGRVTERAWPLEAGKASILRATVPPEESARGIAWSDGRLLVAGRRLLAVPLGGRALVPEPVGGLLDGLPVQGFTAIRKELFLLRSDGTSAVISRVPVERSMAFGALTVVRDAAGPRSASGLATDGARVFVVTPGGLVRYAKPPSGEPGDTETTALGWRSRKDPVYSRYASSMSALIEKLGLAYCYSQILLEDNGIAYILDGTTGPDQALVGGRDQIPEEDWQAARRVIETGTVLVGRIRKFDRWGLLKVAAGPIKDRQGRIAATTGVDVNITTIQGRTRVVLLQVLFLGSVALIVATALSVGLARRLTRPLSLIKGAALRVAAGQAGQAVDVQRPLELLNLAQTFNEVSRQTRDHLEGLDRQWHGLETDRHARLLAKRLLTPSRVAQVEETRRGGTGGTVNESGQVHEDGRTLVFLVEGSAADPGASLLLAARRDLARRILAGASALDAERAILRFRGLVPGRLAIVDARSGVVVRDDGDAPRSEPIGPNGAEFESVAPDGASFRVAVKSGTTSAGAKP